MAITVHRLAPASAQLDRQLWPYECTFETPYRDPTQFVETAFSMFPVITAAEVTIHQVVFEPRTPAPLTLSPRSWSEMQENTVLRADTGESSRALVISCLSEWFDFTFCPGSENFTVYADHDEFCTFYTRGRAEMRKLINALVAGGFRFVDGYRRPS